MTLNMFKNEQNDLFVLIIMSGRYIYNNSWNISTKNPFEK